MRRGGDFIIRDDPCASAVKTRSETGGPSAVGPLNIVRGERPRLHRKRVIRVDPCASVVKPGLKDWSRFLRLLRLLAEPEKRSGPNWQRTACPWHSAAPGSRPSGCRFRPDCGGPQLERRLGQRPPVGLARQHGNRVLPLAGPGAWGGEVSSLTQSQDFRPDPP